jgi:SsrA-binding protein
MAAGQRKDAPKANEVLVCRNPKAGRMFEIEEHLEAGIVLMGSEVKSLRAKRADLEGSYARLDGGEMFLHSMYVAPYEQAAAFGHEPRRTRKLLVNAREIEKWQSRITMRGYTIVPVRVYFKGSWVKVELGLGKGRKSGDDREKIKSKIERDEAREAVTRGRRR